MNKAGLFGGGWADYLDALNESFDRHAAENAPQHPLGASVDAIMTGYPDTPQSGDSGHDGAVGGTGAAADPARFATGDSSNGVHQIVGGVGGLETGGSGSATNRYLAQPEYDEFATPKGSSSFMNGGPPQLEYGRPNDADGGAGNPNLARDANGNVIADTATAASNRESGTTDPLIAFRNLMASPTVEGRRNDVYPDSRKIPTVGIGHKVVPSDNLRAGDVISDDRVNRLFAQDGSKALDAAKAQAAQAGISDPEFIAHLASVNFQLGTDWIHPFSATWRKIIAGDYAGAANNLSKSDWAKQTPVRVQQFQSALLALPPKALH